MPTYVVVYMGEEKNIATIFQKNKKEDQKWKMKKK